MARDSHTTGAIHEGSAEVSSGFVRTADSCGSEDEDELTPTNLTVWREPFNLRSFLPQIRKEMTRRAPFLLGSEQAQYTRSFFADIGGLCNEGIPFRKLKNDHGITLEELSRKYPLNRKRNRHPMRLMQDIVSVWNVQRMHQKVYGGSGPDNGEYGTAFLRGVELEFRHKRKVNWAEGAAELASQRMRSSGQNPQKMTPPCVRQQIQGLVDLFEHLIGRAMMAHAAAVAQLREAKLNVRHEAQLDREFSGVLRLEDAPMQRSSKAPKLLPAAMVDVPLQQITTPRQARSAKANTTRKASETTMVAGLLRQKTQAEVDCGKVFIELEQARVELIDKQERRHSLAKEEEALWDEFAELQSVKKEGCHDAATKVTLDSKLRAVLLASGKASEAVEKNEAALLEHTKEVEVLQQKVSTLQAQIREMDCQIDLIIIEESCVRPQQFFTSFPTIPTSMIPLKEKLPCGLCGRFWADMALVNLPCGCLFHPSCMFRIVLRKNPRCPSCDVVPGGVWMGQWGLVTNNATMQAHVEAYRAAMDAEGYAPPLSREDAQIRIRELATLADALTEAGWSVRKRSADDYDCEPGGNLAKLARTNAKLDNEAMPTFHVDPCPSVGSTGLAIALKSTGVHDKLAMELVEIAGDAAAEAASLETAEEQDNDSYQSAEATAAVADLAVPSTVCAFDAVASIASGDGPEQEQSTEQ